MKQRREASSEVVNRSVQRTLETVPKPQMKKQRVFMLVLALVAVLSFESIIKPTVNTDAQSYHAENQGVDGTSSPASIDTQVKQDAVKLSNFQRLCPSETKLLKFLFPHVNKAGGRSIEATFDAVRLASASSMRHVTLLPRSAKMAFDLVDGHRDYTYIANMVKCSSKNSLRSCELSKERLYEGKCFRWIFMLRDPVARLVSAFYTTTGRILTPKPNPNAHHFKCKPGTRAHKLMQDPSFSIEDFVRLDPAERAHCEGQQSNQHVQYLAPDYPPGSKKQFRVARKRLLEMGWFGILERSEESMRLLSYTFGLDLIRYSKVSNVNVYNKNLSSIALSVLTRMNELDIKLYKLAYQVFDRRVAYMLQDKRNVHNNLDRFVCDSNVRCWDKLKEDESAWDREETKELSYLSAGEQKERILCSPKDGCARLSSTSARLMKRNKQRCVISFAIIGARKGGTTSLYNYMVQHDSVYGVKLDKGPQAGEMFFFRRNRDLVHSSSAKLRSLYNKAFLEELDRMRSVQNSQKAKFNPRLHLTGESSVGMGPNCYTPKLLKKACGDNVKLVYLVRNPIERMISQYKMRLRMNTTSEGIEPLVRADLKEFLHAVPKGKTWWEREGTLPCLFEEDYMNSIWSGLYIVHITRWLRYFKLADILVLKSEDFFADPTKVLLHALTFIGIDPRQVDLEEITRKVYNSANSTGGASMVRRKTSTTDVLNPELRQKLRAIFRPYNQALATRFRLYTSDWQ